LTEYIPPSDLAEFFQSSSTEDIIIYFGLGSMLEALFTLEQSKEILQVMLESVLSFNRRSAVRVRCILHAIRGNSHVEMEKSDTNVFQLNYAVPHTWLIPKVNAVFCHGGCGTTHAAIKEGKPVIVVPAASSSDQPFWGSLIQTKKLGYCTSLASKLTVQEATVVIKNLVANLPELTQSATAAGKEMANETPMVSIASLLDSVVQSEFK
jgi:UDP:flavonoid glycosyltransferase YjiC (YdhE family)